MANKSLLVGAGMLTLAGLVGGTSMVSAQFDDKPKIDEDTRTALHEAVEAGDYETWKNLLPEHHPRVDSITEENFSRLQDLHQAKKNGDREQAKAIAEELGLKMHKRGAHKNKHIDDETREARKAAVEAGDYDTWRALHGERFNERFSEDQAAKLFDMHQLRLNGDTDGAQAIAEELGLKKGKRGGEHHRFTNNDRQEQP